MSLSLEKPKANVSETLVSLIKRTPYFIEADVPRANWLQRFVCVFLDYCFAVSVFLVPLSILEVFIIEPIFGEKVLSPKWGGIVFYSGFAFYRPIAQALFHQTFAERLLHIYVANGQRKQISLIQIIKRHACPTFFWSSLSLQYLFSPVIIIGMIGLLVWVGGSFRAFKADRRTLLDIFSGSYVYKKP